MTSHATVDSWDGVNLYPQQGGVSQHLDWFSTRKQYTFQFYVAPGQISGSCDVSVNLDGISAGRLHFDSASSGSDYTLFQVTRTMQTINSGFGVTISCNGEAGTTGEIFLDDFMFWADDEQEACPLNND